MIWNNMLFWNPQMSFPANMVFIIFPVVLGFFVVPAVSFYFLCKCCAVSFRWKGWTVYMIFSILLTVLQMEWKLSGIAVLAPEVLLFAICGCGFMREKWICALSVSVLAVSVRSICSGVTQWLDYWLLWKAGSRLFSIPPCMDLLRELLNIFLLFLIFRLILKTFSQSIRQNNGQILLLLAILAFFISLVERIVRDSIYGNTIVVDSERGMLFPSINHGEIFILQIFAYACLLLILMAYRKITGALQAEQTIQLLNQQKQAQEIYVQEALLHYEQTRSFRHDIKNHLAVLAEFIRKGQTGQAEKYLENLGQVCIGLSYPIQTGNAAVDALLGNKLSAAVQAGIAVQCELKLPVRAGISDMDWCIVLANAIDNAIAANSSLPAEERYILISGKKKGNFYLLSVENRCEKTMQEVPEDGIGLSNIKAAVRKYQGTVKAETGDGIFRLDLLWVLPWGCEGADG